METTISTPDLIDDSAAVPASSLDAVQAVLDAVKAEDIVILDLRGRSALTDHMVVATGQSGRQLLAMADHLTVALKSLGASVSVEGLELCDWVLVDAGDVIVHLFRPEIRAFYQLEKLWQGAGERPSTQLTA